MRRTSILLALLTTAFAVAPALAAEGRTPVFLPGSVLAADGKYILTRNLIAPGGPVITICGANVDLDLNGMLVTNTGGGETITTAGCPGVVDHVTIRNGTIAGGAPGIFVQGLTRKVDIEDVRIKDTAFPAAIHLLDVEGAAIRRVEITDSTNSGIVWNGGGVKHGTIEHNLIRRAAGGMFIFGCSSLAILNNRIEEGGGSGIFMVNCNASLLAENTIERKGVEGIVIRNGRGNKLLDNLVVECGSHGIYLDGNTVDTLVLNNNSSANGFAPGPPGHGLLVEGQRNLIERNVLNANAGAGLIFLGGGAGGAACGTTYGRNTARGNGLAGGCGAAPPGQLPPDFCDTAVGCVLPNTSYGDNLMPGPPIG